GRVPRVELVPGREEEGVGCEAKRDRRAEATMNPDGSCRVVGGRDDASRGGAGVASDDDGTRVGGEPRPLGGLDREVETIAVEEEVARRARVRHGRSVSAARHGVHVLDAGREWILVPRAAAVLRAEDLAVASGA